MGNEVTGQERKDKLEKGGYSPSDVQQRVNKLAAPPKPKLKAINVIANEVVEGKWSYGQERFNRLNKTGYIAQQVEQEVNKILRGQKEKTKSVEVLAQEVIDGKHGSGDSRRKSLGSLYIPVHNLVNQMLREITQTPQNRTTEQMGQRSHCW